MTHKGKTIDKINKYQVIDCRTCKFIHITPLPTPQELNKIYSNDYYVKQKPKYISRDVEDQKWWETVYEDRLEVLNKYSKGSKKLLEFGSGPGLFLKYAKKNGWDVLGVEPSVQAAVFARKNSIPIIQKFVDDINFKDLEKFDAITMYEFLEHVPNPIEILKIAHKALTKRGIISIGVPNDYNPLQDVVRKGLKLKPYWLAPPFHINYFSPSSLEGLLNQMGFKVIYKTTNFPLEMFLLMGDMYVGNDKIGRKIHSKRKKFDIQLTQLNNSLKTKLYEALANLNIGRDLTIYAQKT